MGEGSLINCGALPICAATCRDAAHRRVIDPINKFIHAVGASLQRCCAQCLICCKEVSQPSLGHMHLFSGIDSLSPEVIYWRSAAICRVNLPAQVLTWCLLITSELVGSLCDSSRSLTIGSCAAGKRKQKQAGSCAAQFYTSDFKIVVILDLRGALRERKKRNGGKKKTHTQSADTTGRNPAEVLLHPQTQLETFPCDRGRLSLARLPHIW